MTFLKRSLHLIFTKSHYFRQNIKWEWCVGIISLLPDLCISDWLSNAWGSIQAKISPSLYLDKVKIGMKKKLSGIRNERKKIRMKILVFDMFGLKKHKSNENMKNKNIICYNNNYTIMWKCVTWRRNLSFVSNDISISNVIRG